MKHRKIINILLFIGIFAFIFHFLSCNKIDIKEVTSCNIENLSAVNATTINVELNVIELSPDNHPDFGICYSSVNEIPTTADSFVSLGFVNEKNLYNKNIENLCTGTKYYFRGYIMNGNETKYSLNIKEFVTPELPIVTSIASTNVLMNQVTINGKVNAKGITTKVMFEYGPTSNYGMEITPSQSPVIGNLDINLSADIMGLSAVTTYHYRIKGINAVGCVYGNDITFTTTNIPAPTAITNEATNISTTSTKLNGIVNANGQNTAVSFEYGLTTAYGNTVIANQSPVSGTANTAISYDISNLSKNALYHFRLKAVSIGGTIYGDDITFTTASVPAPTVLTNAVSNLSYNSASLNGVVNANDQSTNVSFEYGTTTNYGSTVNANPGTLTGITATSVSSNITGLAANTLYHFRVKAISAGGTVYGSDLTFTTNIIPAPTASSSAATNIIITSANINGAVNANGQIATVTFEYGITTSYGSTTFASVGTVSGNVAANVSTNITGLIANTLYLFRVKAVSAGGTAYGNDVTFKTAESIDGTVTDIDGNVYNTIIIGAQVWMRENLKTTKYSDGSAITLVTDNIAWTTAGAAYCWYNNNAATYKITYGALYNWKAVDPTSNGYRNLCPAGWHVPSDEEWTTLINFLDGEYLAGGKLKESGFVHWKSPNSGANNSSGFTALPGGLLDYYGSFVRFGTGGNWWSTTEDGLNDAMTRAMNNYISSVERVRFTKNTGMSVRCIKD